MALVVQLAWQAVQLAWSIMGARQVPGAGVPTAIAPVPSGPAIDVGSIVNAHLFGVPGATGSGEADPGSVAATQMNLVLVGTIAYADPQKGYAIVGDSPATDTSIGSGAATPPPRPSTTRSPHRVRRCTSAFTLP